VYFSERFDAAGPVSLEFGTVTYAQPDGPARRQSGAGHLRTGAATRL